MQFLKSNLVKMRTIWSLVALKRLRRQKEKYFCGTSILSKELGSSEVINLLLIASISSKIKYALLQMMDLQKYGIEGKKLLPNLLI